MTHRALYLAYRPQTFADLAGQHAVAATLKRALKNDRVAHAYLFTGPRGTGKTTTARLLAKGVNCAHLKDGEPDNSCELCQAITAGSALDVIEVDAASNRGIDEIREIRDKVGIAPSSATRKVYIIDEVHMLTKEAFNALLKTLEEPPAHAMFVLATTDPQKVPQTIISRCQRFDLRLPTVPVIAKLIGDVAKAEKLKLDEEAATLLARYAKGSFRDALSLLDLMRSVTDDAITVEVIRETLGLADSAAVAELERALVAGDTPTALGTVRTALEQGTAADTFRLAVVEYLRLLMVAAAGGPAADPVRKLAADWTLPQLVRAVRAFLDAGETSALSAELPLELAVLEIAGLQNEPAAEQPRMTAPVAPEARTPSRETPDSAAAVETPKVVTQREEPKADAEPEARATVAVAEPSLAPDADATELWEALLKATKGEYSLSLCLQKTRPEKLEDGALHLQVQSDFFLKKLENPAVQTKLQTHTKAITGKPVGVKLKLAAPGETELFDEALALFAGARVE